MRLREEEEEKGKGKRRIVDGKGREKIKRWQG